MRQNQYFIYIITNQDNTVLYTGVTNELQRRIAEHRSGKGGSFSKRYKLVYYKSGDDITKAISREKRIKGGSRKDKINLITASIQNGKIYTRNISLI